MLTKQCVHIAKSVNDAIYFRENQNDDDDDDGDDDDDELYRSRHRLTRVKCR